MCGYMGAMLRAYSPHYGDFWLSPLGVVRGLLAFPLGCVLARLMAGSVDSIRPHAGRLEALSLASMVAASMADRPESILPGCAGLIVALSLDAGPAARLLRGRPWHWLGQVSFSVYSFTCRCCF